MGLLDGEIASLVGGALDFMLFSGTLRRETGSTVDSYGDPVAGTPATFAFRGYTEDFTASYRARAGIPATDIKIMIAGSSIATVPKVDDRLTMKGVWYQARGVTVDPAGAMYEVQAFQIGAP